MRLARISPSLSLKLWLYRMMGIRVGSNVSIALEVTMDVFFPQLIEIGDNTIIGYNTTILCHEFLIKEYVTGPVVIGRDVMVGGKHHDTAWCNNCKWICGLCPFPCQQ